MSETNIPTEAPTPEVVAQTTPVTETPTISQEEILATGATGVASESSATEQSQPLVSDASETPAVDPTAEPERPVLISRLIHVIGAFLAANIEKLEKAEHEVSDEMKHLYALFSQHLMLVNSINADAELANKVIEAVDKEIAKVTAEFGSERKPNPVSSESSNIITPNFHG